MKQTSRTAMALIALTFFAATAGAADFTKGKIKKIDRDAGKVTIIHEELKSLDMPAMTMVFRLADATMLDAVKEGDAIEFVADRLDGKLTVVEIKK